MLKSFYETMDEQAQILVRNLKENAAKGKSFEIVQLFQNCALDIICLTAMGISVNAQANPDSKYVHMIER